MGRVVLLINFLFITVLLSGQAPGYVRFEPIELDEAITRAKATGKKIFVDTYAPWCVPCKKLYPVFRDRNVAKYMNDNYISIKINMDTYKGKEISARYHVAFLPTLLFLESDGRLRLSIDRVVTKEEMLAFAQTAMHPPQRRTIVEHTSKIKPIEQKEVTSESQVAEITTKPVQSEAQPIEQPPKEVTEQEVIIQDQQYTTDEERILMIFDEDNAEMSPQELYRETYFRMQLMDGSHWVTASKYLETQQDWSDPKNMRFIFDFVRSTNSPEYNYIIENREQFNDLIGQVQIDRTVDILAYTRLNQGIPRPELDEAMMLYVHVKSPKPKLSAYKYIIKRQIDEESHDNILNTINSYLEIDGYQDKKMLHLFGDYAVSTQAKKKELITAKRYLSALVEEEANNSNYHLTLARIYYKLSNKSKATYHSNQVLSLESDNTELKEQTTKLIEQINTML